MLRIDLDKVTDVNGCATYQIWSASSLISSHVDEEEARKAFEKFVELAKINKSGRETIEQVIV
jgi:hypothetical protein